MVKESLLHAENIEILNFSIHKGMIENPEDFDSEEIIKHNFSVNLEMGFNLDEDLIRSTIILDVQTDSGGNNENEAKSSFYLAFLFHYPGLGDLVLKTDTDEIEFHPHLGNAISSITYSTSRGILMTRYQGTPFESFILPVVDPNSLLVN